MILKYEDGKEELGRQVLKMVYEILTENKCIE